MRSLLRNLFVALALIGQSAQIGAQTGPIAVTPAPVAPSGNVLNNTQVSEASKLHVVMLVYGPKTNFGDACRKDVQAMRTMLEQGFGAKSDRIVYHDFTGKNPITDLPWAPWEITAALKQIRLGANESILLFHSGHGCVRNEATPEQTFELDIDSGGVSRQELLNILKAQRPRGLIVLTDCCSSYVPQVQAQRGPVQDNVMPARFNTASVQNLFLKLRGYVNITAAELGTGALPAYTGSNPGNAGSAFTVALVRLLCQDATFQNWSQFYPVLKNETHQASSGLGQPAHKAHAFAIEEATATMSTAKPR